MEENANESESCEEQAHLMELESFFTDSPHLEENLHDPKFDDITSKLENVAPVQVVSDLKLLWTNRSKAHKTAISANKDLKAKCDRLETEISDVRSAAALTVDSQDDEYKSLKQKFEEEMASLNSINEERVNQLRSTFKEHQQSWQSERARLLDKITSLGSENSPDAGEQRTSTLARVINRARSSFNSLGLDDDDSSTESNELEIAHLRRQLKTAHTEIHNLRRAQTLVPSSSVTTSSDNSPFKFSSNHGEGDILDDDMEDERLMVSRRGWDLLQRQLRETKVELESMRSEQPSTSKATGEKCLMCENYEDQLQSVQSKLQQTAAELKEAFHESDRTRNDLLLMEKRCQVLDRDLQVRSREQAEKVKKLTEISEAFEAKYQTLESSYHALRQETEAELRTCAENETKASKLIKDLKLHYSALLQVRRKAAEQTSNDDIELPNNVTDLQLLVLQQREELITTRSSIEHLEERIRAQEEAHNAQADSLRQEAHTIEAKLRAEVEALRIHEGKLTEQVAALEQDVDAVEKATTARKSAEVAVQRLQKEVTQLTEQSKTLEDELNVARNKVATMLNDINNSEAVQCDLVKLNQQLQIQLERLRQEDCEPRWQELDDVCECLGCREKFPSGSTGNRRKHHCRHCGKVFCAECLRSTVPSGAKKKQVPVCSLCHTLLMKNAVPFFASQMGPRNAQSESPRLS